MDACLLAKLGAAHVTTWNIATLEPLSHQVPIETGCGCGQGSFPCSTVPRLHCEALACRILR